MKEIIHAQLELKMITYDTEEERDIHMKEMNNNGWQIKRSGEYNLCAESTVTAYCDKNNWSCYAEYFKEQQSNIKDENISYESETYWFGIYNKKEE
jgi:hypothetical protein